jgi:hypothetical protein
MTMDEIEAEIAHMDGVLRRLKQDAIRQIQADLAVATSPYQRECLERDLAKVKAMRPELEAA